MKIKKKIDKFIYRNCDKSLLILVLTYLSFLAFIIVSWPMNFSQSRQIEKIEKFKNAISNDEEVKNSATNFSIFF